MKLRVKANLKQEDKNGAYKLHSKVVMDGITYEVIKKYQEFGRFGPEFVYDLKDPEGVIVKNVGHKEIRVKANLKQASDLNFVLYSPSTEKYYTGKAGEGWLGSKDEAFLYSQEGGERQAKKFNEGGFAVRDWQVVERSRIKANLRKSNQYETFEQMLRSYSGKPSTIETLENYLERLSEENNNVEIYRVWPGKSGATIEIENLVEDANLSDDELDSEYEKRSARFKMLLTTIEKAGWVLTEDSKRYLKVNSSPFSLEVVPNQFSLMDKDLLHQMGIKARKGGDWQVVERSKIKAANSDSQQNRVLRSFAEFEKTLNAAIHWTGQDVKRFEKSGPDYLEHAKNSKEELDRFQEISYYLKGIHDIMEKQKWDDNET